MTQRRLEPPTTVEEFIAEVLRAASLPAERAQDVRADLHAHFEDGLAQGHSPQDLIQRFGDPRVAGERLAHAQGDPTVPGLSERRADHSFAPPARPSRWANFRAGLQELAAAPRAIGRAPRYALLVVVTLALGVGANTAVFSVLDAVLLRSLPYPAPEELVSVTETWEGGPGYDYLRVPTIHAMRSWDDVFEQVAAIFTYRQVGADLTGGERPERLDVSPVSSGFFEMLGGRAILGRAFDEDESFGPGEYGVRESRPRVAVLSHDLWTRRFGADPDLVGRTIQLDGESVEVIGVMQEGFANPVGAPADLWIPQDMRLGGSNGWSNYYLTVVARLRPDVTLDQADERIATHVAAVRETEPESGEWGLRLVPLQSELVGSSRRTLLWILAAAVALVLLSACVNVANLVFARGLQRERELAMRGVLGAGRTRLAGQLLAENAWLAVLGTAGGLLVAWAGVRALLLAAPDALPGHANPGPSLGLFLFALTVVLATLTLFGLGPSWLLSRVAPARALRSGRSGSETRGLRRVRTALVVAQTSVALVLLIGAGLLLRSFQQVQQQALGVQTEQVLTFEVHLPQARYPDGAARQAFHERLQDRVATLPGVVARGATSWLPLSGRYHIWGPPIRLEDATAEEPEVRARAGAADVRIINGDLFGALGINLLRGQAPDQIEVHPEGEALVWISRTVADQLFEPGEDPIGEPIFSINQLRRIVGVVEDVAIDGRGTKFPTVYVHHEEFSDDRNWALAQVVRTEGDPMDVASAIAAELERLDADLVLHEPRAFDALVSGARAQDRFALLLMSLFASLATLLVVIGTYGVLAGHVAQHRRDYGIHMALGATGVDVLRQVLGRALRMSLVGVFFGGALAWAGSRWMSSVLFEVAPGDPVALLGAIAAVFGLSLVAGFLPARRATRVDPARSLTESS